MQSEHDRRDCHLCARVSGGHECIGQSVDLHLDADGHRIVWFFAESGGRPFCHFDIVGRFDDVDAISHMRAMRELAAEELGELVFYGRCLPDELNGVRITQLVECE